MYVRRFRKSVYAIKTMQRIVPRFPTSSLSFGVATTHEPLMLAASSRSLRHQRIENQVCQEVDMYFE